MQAPQRDPVTGTPFRRRATGRVVAGVAGGLADHFDTPVIWPRLAFLACALVAGGSLFRFLTKDPWDPAFPGVYDVGAPLGTIAGLGVFAYAVLWFTTSRADRTASPAHVLRSRFPGAPSWLGVALFVLGGAVLGGELGLWRSNVVWALLLIVAGVVLFRRDAARSVPNAERTIEPDLEQSPAEPGEATASRTRRRRHERSPLGWFCLGVMLLVTGGAAILANVGVAELGLQQFPALALLVLAVGLIVGAWWGRARWLILPALLLVPVLLATSLIHVPLEGGFGDVGVAGRRDPSGSYRRVAGRMDLDLMSFERTNERIEIDATTGLGDVSVFVPHDALVIARASTSYGDVYIGRRWDSGFDAHVTRRWEPRLGEGATIVLDLESGIGSVHVMREGLSTRQRNELRREEGREER
jgi:phage shock protein PspC (stress-responsive transcriptional regulator)